MKILITLSVSTVFSVSTAMASPSDYFHAEPRCESASQQWMSEKVFFEKLAKQGYKIYKAKVSKRGCYKVEGTDKNGVRLEAHFDPTTGEELYREIKRSHVKHGYDSDRH